MSRQGPKMTKDPALQTDLKNTSMTNTPTVDSRVYLAATRAIVSWHPAAFSKDGSRVLYPESFEQEDGLSNPELLPIKVDSNRGHEDSAIVGKWLHERVDRSLPILAACRACSTLSLVPDVYLEETEYKYFIMIDRDFAKKVCGPLLPDAVIYTALFRPGTEQARENLESFFTVGSGIGLVDYLLFEQLDSDALLQSAHFEDLCVAIDTSGAFVYYAQRYRADGSALISSNPVVSKALKSFSSLSPQEVRWICEEARANARDQCAYQHLYRDRGKRRMFTDAELDDVKRLATCVALLKGDAQIVEAERLLSDNRLFGLTALNLLVCPWQEANVRATALRRIVQEDPVFGREMAKIIFVQNDCSLMHAVAKELLGKN
jgi:hypothetical protein